MVLSLCATTSSMVNLCDNVDDMPCPCAFCRDCIVQMPNDTIASTDAQVLDRGSLPESQAFGSGPLADAEERRAIFNVLDSFR